MLAHQHALFGLPYFQRREKQPWTVIDILEQDGTSMQMGKARVSILGKLYRLTSAGV